ncbi:unnamed protein product [Alopecurus aequalis]
MGSRDATILAYRNQRITQQGDTSHDANGIPTPLSTQYNTRTQNARRGLVAPSREELNAASTNQQTRQSVVGMSPSNDMRNTEQESETTRIRSSQLNSMTSPTNWPSHARRCRTETVPDDQRKKGRGVLKGIKVAKKRFVHGSSKLNIEFSSTLGGSIGENYRSFVDDVVVYMKRRAPLIGANKWSDIENSIKSSIVADVIEKWDLEDTTANTKKILTIARERYRGWRSALHSTYKAYTTDAERRINKPEDVSAEEWEYLIDYFGNNLKFQRDPETGQEPTILQLWKITHTKGGSWSNNESQAVYDNACSQIRQREGEIQGPVSSQEEQNIFHASYRSTMECRSSQPRGHGYMAKPASGSERMRAELDEQARASSEIQRQNVELNNEVHGLKDQIAEMREARLREGEEEHAAREKERDEERIARQRDIEEAKQSMKSEVVQSMRAELVQSMKAELMQMMGSKKKPTQQLSQSKAGPSNGTGNISRSIFGNSSMITQHQLTQAAKNYCHPTNDKGSHGPPDELCSNR